MGVLVRASRGVVDRARLLQQARDLGPALQRDAALVDDAGDQRTRGAVGAGQQPDDRQRDLAFAQIAADRLAERRGVACEVEQVVHQLERDAEIEPVVAQRALLLGRRLAEHPADLGAAGKEIRRLAPDDVEVLVFGDVDVAVLRQLIQLAFDHPQRDVAEQPDDLQRVLRQRQRHRLDVEEVAEEHGDVVAPLRVDGQAATTVLGVVDDVVVDQRRGVDELDDGGVRHRALALVAAQPRRHQQHRRPHALAAALLDVLADFGDETHLRLQVTAELPLDPGQVVADRLEQAEQIGRRAVDGTGQDAFNLNIVARGVSTRCNHRWCKQF